MVFSGWVTENRAAVTLQTLLAMATNQVKTDIDGTWTQQKEDELLDAFEKSPERQWLSSAASDPPWPPKDYWYWTMWKSIPRVRSIIPTGIVGVLKFTYCGDDVHLGDKIIVSNPNWPEDFSEALTKLALGSICGDDMGLLSLLIRWTVADRIDDRRRMHIENLGAATAEDASFLDYLRAIIPTQQEDDDLRDLHENVRLQLLLGTKKTISWISQVMRRVEEIHGPRFRTGDSKSNGNIQSQHRRTLDGIPMYRVETQDLHTLATAMDTYEGRPPEAMTVFDVGKTMNEARQGPDSPNYIEELRAVRQAAQLAEGRVMEKRLLIKEQCERVLAALSTHGNDTTDKTCDG